MRKYPGVGVILLSILCFFGPLGPREASAMNISSTSYPNGGTIPLKYVMRTIGGENISPEFSWKDYPKETRSFALIMYDPHPIAHNWVHWAVIDIPSHTSELPEGVSGKGIIPFTELINSFGFKGYGGPQPPKGSGAHPYVTEIFALDVEHIKMPSRPSYRKFLEVVSPHILDRASYTGYFEQK